MRHVVQSLADTLLRVGAGRDIEQALIRFGILDDGGGFALDREHDRAFRLLQLFHEVARRPAKCRQRLNVTCDIQHMRLLLYRTLLGAVRLHHPEKRGNFAERISFLYAA